MNKYKEILRLKGMLEKAKIPFEFSELFGGYHVSFARKSKMPTYAEMKMIKRDFIGEDKKAIFVLPKKEQFVNINKFCLHLWTCENDILPDFDCGLGTI